ncbi:hypothetical protein P152DRAFT_465912 [Eremomyces bilateralis CBS 781.70]|uniref:Sequence orphan n=1 Tax=Eremomyces bilateralis CBS 781.70 TaxID=1392243 RepID=A0A6G1G5K0_9PEZI|nr:uncharacterized protein P152DRAFT_465912 [Eremomyces bilateralis CBS 781.70]KAF1813282.1 hypothetical protein P152DRAFT_465912 [Eremomyces bilateralis CBS 781.70]
MGEQHGANCGVAKVPDRGGQGVAMSGRLTSQLGEESRREKGVAESRYSHGRTWNTKNLGLRSLSDVVAAATAGVLVAPVVTTIDKAIIENTSGRNTMRESIRSSLQTLLLRPHHFLSSRPFRLIFTLYSGTYLTANWLDTASSTLHSTPAPTTTHGAPKFLATSAANLSLCLYKDAQFTQLFASLHSAPRPVPLPSFALFSLRDCLTIFASFNLPPLIAPHLPMHLAPALEERVSRTSMAQFLAPAGIQVFSTPLHLLGLDHYNRPHASWRERLGKVGKEWGVSCLARMCRIVPAFGVGGVVNSGVRRHWMEKWE